MIDVIEKEGVFRVDTRKVAIDYGCDSEEDVIPVDMWARNCRAEDTTFLGQDAIFFAKTRDKLRLILKVTKGLTLNDVKVTGRDMSGEDGMFTFYVIGALSRTLARVSVKSGLKPSANPGVMYMTIVAKDMCVEEPADGQLFYSQTQERKLWLEFNKGVDLPPPRTVSIRNWYNAPRISPMSAWVDVYGFKTPTELALRLGNEAIRKLIIEACVGASASATSGTRFSKDKLSQEFMATESGPVVCIDLGLNTIKVLKWEVEE